MGRVGEQQPAKGGTGPLRGGRECGRGGKGIARVKDIFSQVSVCTAIPIPIGWCLFKIRGSVGRNYRLVSGSQELARLCSWHYFYDLSSYSGLNQPPCQSSTELLPACLAFLPLPLLNRLRQQDGTNLWLNSPKITRDLSKAVCVKLTGACTLLSNARSSEAGPGTPLCHCPPVPGLVALPISTSPIPPDLAIDLVPGVP